MSMLYKSTENPHEEQWRMLSQFAYPSNIQSYLKQIGFKEILESNVELIAGCIRQGEAFFNAAKNAPIDISPLLFYYGTTNLLTGVYTLLTNSKPAIENHGMLITPITANRIADVSILPRNREKGALQLFCNVFSNSCEIVSGASWTMEEIIGSVPDLKHDFESHYQGAQYFTVPVEVVKTRQRSLERIQNEEFRSYAGIEDAINLIPNFLDAYLEPQYKAEYVIMNYKRGGIEIGAHTISGRKYLQLGHLKNGRLISPHQLILLYMGLYILGSLPRYHPDLWHPFVRGDTTGEKYIIEKFLAVCNRFIPNLVLNFVFGKRIVFVNETEGLVDYTNIFTKDELESIIRNGIKELYQTGGI